VSGAARLRTRSGRRKRFTGLAYVMRRSRNETELAARMMRAT
jgi:hypothetical protein